MKCVLGIHGEWRQVLGTLVVLLLTLSWSCADEAYVDPGQPLSADLPTTVMDGYISPPDSASQVGPELPNLDTGGAQSDSVSAVDTAVDPPDTCVATCAGKMCGDNGCGGSCGTCDAGQVCDAGACVDDGPVDPCGGITYEGCCDDLVLTWCEAGEVMTIDCAEAPNPSCGWAETQGYYNCGEVGPGPDEFPLECSASCVPSCENMVCGDDGCGGICGTCGDGTTCDAGQCVENPAPTGACTNDGDAAIIEAQDVNLLAEEAAIECLADPDTTKLVMVIDTNLHREFYGLNRAGNALWVRSHLQTMRLGELRLGLDEQGIRWAQDRKVDLDEEIPSMKDSLALSKKARREIDRAQKAVFP